MRVGTVAELWCHPVKSMRGERRDELDLVDGGVPGDRGWGVRPLGGDEVLSAKRTPALLQAAARVVDPDGDPHGTVEVALPDGRRLAAGDPAADGALSAWLGRDVRLERPDPGRPAGYDVPLEDGSVVRAPCPPASFQDSRSSNLHLLATPTLGDDDVRRYRPNVVVETDGGPFAEDAWVGQVLRVGAAEVEVTKPCGRCVLVTHPQPGLPADRTRLTRLTGRGGTLGVLARVRVPGRVRLGDAVALVP